MWLQFQVRRSVLCIGRWGSAHTCCRAASPGSCLGCQGGSTGPGWDPLRSELGTISHSFIGLTRKATTSFWPTPFSSPLSFVRFFLSFCFFFLFFCSSFFSVGFFFFLFFPPGRAGRFQECGRLFSFALFLFLLFLVSSSFSSWLSCSLFLFASLFNCFFLGGLVFLSQHVR